MGGVQDPGGSGNDAARVLHVALQQLIDEVEGDFVVYSLRPPTADVGEYAQTVTRTGDERAGYLASYWGRLRPSDFPSWPTNTGIPMVVDLGSVSAMEKQLVDGSPIEVGSMLTVTAHNGVTRLGTLCVVRSDSSRQWSAADQEAVLSAGALLSACVQSDAVTIDQEHAAEGWRQLVHRSHALAAAARMLRSDRSDEGLRRALLEVLPASDAAALFVKVNETDEEGQSVALSAANVESDGTDVSQVEYWHGMEWDRMPESRARLSRGLTSIVRRDRLSGVEADTFAESRIGSELDVPLFRGDDWVGLIGMADGDESFDWSLDLPFLQILGDLVSARFERDGLPSPMDV